MSLRRNLGEGSLIISDEVLASVMQFQQTRPTDTEAGGQLFAKFIGPDVHVVDATVPNPLDSRGRFSFQPNMPLQCEQIKARFARGLHFVGDWHTHPEPHPKPSSEDIASMQDCFRRSAHNLAAFIMLIVGTARPPEGCYIGVVNGDCIETLAVA